MTGNGFGESAACGLGDSIGNAIGCGTARWPAPMWKLGVRVSDDRGDI